jgi:hypothetical protein
MPQPYGKAVTNESIYPNIVELAVTAGGLEVELARRIIEFHKLRHIEPRHGRRIHKEKSNLLPLVFFRPSDGSCLPRSVWRIVGAREKAMTARAPEGCPLI